MVPVLVPQGVQVTGTTGSRLLQYLGAATYTSPLPAARRKPVSPAASLGSGYLIRWPPGIAIIIIIAWCNLKVHHPLISISHVPRMAIDCIDQIGKPLQCHSASYSSALVIHFDLFLYVLVIPVKPLPRVALTWHVDHSPSTSFTLQAYNPASLFTLKTANQTERPPSTWVKSLNNSRKSSRLRTTAL